MSTGNPSIAKRYSQDLLDIAQFMANFDVTCGNRNEAIDMLLRAGVSALTDAGYFDRLMEVQKVLKVAKKTKLSDLPQEAA